MPKKKNAFYDVQQTGFGFEAVDQKTGVSVPWAIYTDKLVDAIAASPWHVIDTETTGLTPASEPVLLSARDIRNGHYAKLRMRVLTVIYQEALGAEQLVAFDMDHVRAMPDGRKKAQRLVQAALRGTFIAHNAGFDLFWMRHEQEPHQRTMPDLVLDTLLLSRVFRPDIPLVLVQQAQGYDVEARSGDPISEAAWSALSQGKSGWALAQLSLAMLDHIMPKEYQGPKNWVVEVLGAEHYGYATADAIKLLDITKKLLGVAHGSEIVQAYENAKVMYPELAILEPQVPELVEMREHGMPASREQALAYAKSRYAKAAEAAQRMGEIAPEVKDFVADFADPDKGLSKLAKAALASAFRNLGITIRTTDATGEPQVGEKDLRLAGAERPGPAQPLFEAWVSVAKSKKAAQMALELVGFMDRSPDGKIHPLLGHGPATGRLASSEPNSQQFPRDPEFRAIVEAALGHGILASDYSALDMRVGAALAIRAQRQIEEVYHGLRTTGAKATEIIRYVFEHDPAKVWAQYKKHVAVLQKRSADLRAIPVNERDKKYWRSYDEVKVKLLNSRFGMRLAEIRVKAREAGESDYSALRDAFRLGVDIHTYTAMGMQGINQKAEFSGLTGKALKDKQKDWRHKLGDKRQHGKIGNLSLLYAMKARGLSEAAGKIYNVHWTIEESEQIIVMWLDAYPEVDLWHLWTELNPHEELYVPDSDRGGKFSRTQVYLCETLGGRKIYAFGLNAALSYADQSSGADILGMVMHELHENYPDLFAYAVNQVHDEMVFHLPLLNQEENVAKIRDVMDECANRLLMPYGVPSSCSPALGGVWLKEDLEPDEFEAWLKEAKAKMAEAEALAA